MKFIPNIKKKMRAYSIWAMMLSMALFLLPEFYYAYAGTELASPYLVGRLAIFMGVFGIVGWFVDQRIPNLLRTTKLAAISLGISAGIVLLMTLPAMAMDTVQVVEPVSHENNGVSSEEDFLVIAVPLVSKWEGLRTTAYLDRIASPAVWTVCFGETRGVEQGDSYTVAECEGMLAREILVFRDNLHSAYNPETLSERLPATRDTAYTSLAYNAGVHAISRSTAVRRLNGGDIVGGCEALTWWNKAGGRVVRGLVNRRTEERSLCMDGIS
jgi:GH24 family phage-related lysozyme (muramidase)